MRTYLTFENFLLGSHDQPQEKNFLLQDDRQSAFSVLISTPPDSPNFTLEVVKAAFLDDFLIGRGMTPSVAALMSGGKADDAVDLAMLMKQFRDAARLLLSDGKVEPAVQIIAAMFSEAEVGAIANLIATTLINGENKRALIGLFMVWQRFHDTARLLRGKKCEFVATVVADLRMELFISRLLTETSFQGPEPLNKVVRISIPSYLNGRRSCVALQTPP
jgi:hypothetical protein